MVAHIDSSTCRKTAPSKLHFLISLPKDMVRFWYSSYRVGRDDDEYMTRATERRSLGIHRVSLTLPQDIGLGFRSFRR